MSDAECGTGFGAFCSTEAGSGEPGGNCFALICFPGFLECPVGLDCVGSTCVESCASNTDCRTGYRCNTASECKAYGSGSSAVGAACSLVTTCAGGFDARCRTAAVDYPGGYCTRVCSATISCPSGSHCAAGGTGINTRYDNNCVDDCTADNQCRAGYVCAQRDTVAGLECLPGGTGSAAVGSACNNLQNCGGRERALCLEDWPDGGTCALDCTTGTCPGGTTCATVGSAKYCLKSCTSQVDCRLGYNCTSGTCQK